MARITKQEQQIINQGGSLEDIKNRLNRKPTPGIPPAVPVRPDLELRNLPFCDCNADRDCGLNHICSHNEECEIPSGQMEYFGPGRCIIDPIHSECNSYPFQNPICSEYCIEELGYSLGDVTNDGFINVVDIIQTVNQIMNPSQLTPCEQWAADVNQDGLINVSDIVSQLSTIFDSTGGSCGCTNPYSTNFDPSATYEDFSCNPYEQTYETFELMADIEFTIYRNDEGLSALNQGYCGYDDAGPNRPWHYKIKRSIDCLGDYSDIDLNGGTNYREEWIGTPTTNTLSNKSLCCSIIMPVPGSAHTLQEHQCYDFNSVNSVEPDCGNMINNFTGIDCVSSDDTNTALFNSGTEIEKTSCTKYCYNAWREQHIDDERIFGPSSTGLNSYQDKRYFDDSGTYTLSLPWIDYPCENAIDMELDIWDVFINECDDQFGHGGNYRINNIFQAGYSIIKSKCTSTKLIDINRSIDGLCIDSDFIVDESIVTNPEEGGTGTTPGGTSCESYNQVTCWDGSCADDHTECPSQGEETLECDYDYDCDGDLMCINDVCRCEDGYVQDCGTRCISQSIYENVLMGDDYCSCPGGEGSNCNLNCQEHNYEDGDCCPEGTDIDECGTCDGPGFLVSCYVYNAATEQNELIRSCYPEQCYGTTWSGDSGGPQFVVDPYAYESCDNNLDNPCDSDDFIQVGLHSAGLNTITSYGVGTSTMGRAIDIFYHLDWIERKIYSDCWTLSPYSEKEDKGPQTRYQCENDTLDNCTWLPSEEYLLGCTELAGDFGECHAFNNLNGEPGHCNGWEDNYNPDNCGVCIPSVEMDSVVEEPLNWDNRNNITSIENPIDNFSPYYLMYLNNKTQTNNRIVGGQEVEPACGSEPNAQNRGCKYPFMVKWSSPVSPISGHTCGGSLIHPEWVLSAAHCLPWMCDDLTGNGYHICDNHELNISDDSAIQPYRFGLNTCFGEDCPGTFATALHNPMFDTELNNPPGLLALGVHDKTAAQDYNVVHLTGVDWIIPHKDYRGTGGYDDHSNGVATDIVLLHLTNPVTDFDVIRLNGSDNNHIEITHQSLNIPISIGWGHQWFFDWMNESYTGGISYDVGALGSTELKESYQVFDDYMNLEDTPGRYDYKPGPFCEIQYMDIDLCGEHLWPYCGCDEACVDFGDCCPDYQAGACQ
tara:strand:- start:2958 stop:6443 length:3486 start_codon:yes stop_codon:yes gene_type:complete